MISYCPHCASKLIENKKLAQCIWQCGNCSGRFLILETTKPNTEIENKKNKILPNS